MVFCLFSATDCSFLWPVNWQVVRGSRFSGSDGMVLVHWQSNPRGQPGQGAAHAVKPPCRTPGRVSSHPRVGNDALSRTGGGWPPRSSPGPRDSSTLGSEQVYCMLSWPKLHGKQGQQAGEMTLRGGEGELLEVPWPQVTASELRPDDLRTFSAGGRGSRQGHKRQ